MPPVEFVLLRGLARESGHWGAFTERLQEQSYVKSLRTVDLMGTGRFRKLSSPLSIRENAEFVVSQLLDQGDQPRVLVSISLGSMVAVEMGHIYPSLFEKIFVMNPSFSKLSPVHHRLQLNAYKHFFQMAKTKSSIEREREVLSMVSNIKEDHQEIARKWARIAEIRPIPIKNFFRQLIAAGTYRLPKEKPQVPIVVLNSEADHMVHPSCSDKFAQHWGLPIHKHPTAGHDLCVDAPEWVLQQIESELSAS